MNGECSCWCQYPNDAHKRGNGKWKCVDDYVCVRPLKKDGERRRAFKTKCVKKRIDRRGGTGMTKEQKDKILKALAEERNDYVRDCDRRIAEEQGKIIGADYMIQRFLDILKTESEEQA